MTSGDPAQPPRRVDRAGIVIAASLAGLAAVLVWDARGLQSTAMYGMGPEAMPVVIANWRSVVAPPGITPEQRKTLSDAVEKMVKSDAWKEILKQKGWEDAYLGGDAFADFLKKETVRVTDVLKSVGLVKS